jgi:hypothetical protein
MRCCPSLVINGEIKNCDLLPPEEIKDLLKKEHDKLDKE